MAGKNERKLTVSTPDDPLESTTRQASPLTDMNAARESAFKNFQFGEVTTPKEEELRGARQPPTPPRDRRRSGASPRPRAPSTKRQSVGDLIFGQFGGRRDTDSPARRFSFLEAVDLARQTHAGNGVHVKPSKWHVALFRLRNIRHGKIEAGVANLGVARWICAKLLDWMSLSRYRALDRRYQSLRDAVLQDAQKLGVVTNRVFGDKCPVTYRDQGCMEMLQPDVLKVRSALRDHKKVQLAILSVWETLPHCPPPYDTHIDRQIYQWMSLRILSELLPKRAKQGLCVRQTIDQEWWIESGGHYFMDYDTFFSCIFDFLDIWVESLIVDEYVSMAEGIRSSCSTQNDFVYSSKLARRHHAEWKARRERHRDSFRSPEEFPFSEAAIRQQNRLRRQTLERENTSDLGSSIKSMGSRQGSTRSDQLNMSRGRRGSVTSTPKNRQTSLGSQGSRGSRGTLRSSDSEGRSPPIAPAPRSPGPAVPGMGPRGAARQTSTAFSDLEEEEDGGGGGDRVCRRSSSGSSVARVIPVDDLEIEREDTEAAPSGLLGTETSMSQSWTGEEDQRRQDARRARLAEKEARDREKEKGELQRQQASAAQEQKTAAKVDAAKQRREEKLKQEQERREERRRSTERRRSVGMEQRPVRRPVSPCRSPSGSAGDSRRTPRHQAAIKESSELGSDVGDREVPELPDEPFDREASPSPLGQRNVTSATAATHETSGTVAASPKQLQRLPPLPEGSPRAGPSSSPNVRASLTSEGAILSPPTQNRPLGAEPAHFPHQTGSPKHSGASPRTRLDGNRRRSIPDPIVVSVGEDGTPRRTSVGLTSEGVVGTGMSAKRNQRALSSPSHLTPLGKGLPALATDVGTIGIGIGGLEQAAGAVRRGSSPLAAGLGASSPVAGSPARAVRNSPARRHSLGI
eukprot:Hpha_TRINITY_DN15309_c4_g5::TRINITY_DN15309_c4_g5_i2::g.88997::m.88997